MPFLAAVAAGLLPGTEKLFLALAAVRGVLLGYGLSACHVAGADASRLVVQSCCLLPLLCLFCQKIWLSSAERKQ